MKKLLLSFFTCVASVAAASADEVTFDFTANNYGQLVAGSDTEANYMEDGSSFSEGVITVTANKLEGSGVRFWKTDAGAQTFRCNNKSGITVSINGGTITKIVFTGSNYDYYQVDGTNIASGTWEGSATSVAFVNKGKDSKTGTIQMKTMTVTYTGGTVDTRKDAGLAFSADKAEANLGEAFTEPTLTKATTAAVSYASDNEKVATVDAATGKVTLVAAGTAKITASAPANDDYKAGSASYLLTVKDPSIFWGPDCKDKTNSEFTFVALNGDFQPWSVDDRYGLKASAFKNSQANASDAVAAGILLDFTDYTAPMTLDYRQAINQFKINNELIPYTAEALAPYLSVVAQLEGKTEWEKIGDVNVKEGGKYDWNFFDAATVDLARFAGKKVKIGFRYISTAECAGTWEIDHVVVRATKKAPESAIEAIEAADAPVEYYNLQGIRVAEPTHGLYIKRQGNKVTKVIL